LLLRLAETYDVDLRNLGQSGGPASEAELAEAFADPLFQGLAVPRHEIVQLAEDQPAAADAILRLYRAFSDRRVRDRAGAARAAPPAASLAAGERECIQARDTAVPVLEALGEALHVAVGAEVAPPADRFGALAGPRLLPRHGVRVRALSAEGVVEWTRRF